MYSTGLRVQLTIVFFFLFVFLSRFLLFELISFVLLVMVSVGVADPDQEQLPSPSSLRSREQVAMTLRTILKGHGKKPRERQFKKKSPLLSWMGVYMHLFFVFVSFTCLN